MHKQQHADLVITKHPYGRGSRQYFLWVKTEKTQTSDRWVWYLHGGGWQFGQPELFLSQAAFFSRLGYQVILPSFRRIPRYHFDHMAADAKKILQTVPEVISEAGAELNQWMMGGMSAGAHLSAQLYFNPDLLAQQPELLSKLNGIFLFGPPIDFDTMGSNPVIFSLAGKKNNARYQRASVMSHIDAATPQLPIFCYHGEKDGMVPIESTQNFLAHLQSLGWRDLSFFSEADLTHIETAAWSMGETEAGQLLEEWMARVSP